MLSIKSALDFVYFISITLIVLQALLQLYSDGFIFLIMVCATRPNIQMGANNMSREAAFKYSAYPLTGKERELTVYYALPDNMDDQTGMLLLLSGFGGSPEANVYKKMRTLFADQYNLVVVCPFYMGLEFMGDWLKLDIEEAELRKLYTALPIPIRNQVFNKGMCDLKKLIDLNLPNEIRLKVSALLEETDDNFVDMGPVQAVDCMRALKAVYDTVSGDGSPVNIGRILAYGHSHGAYLAHLCNRFFPNVFLSILDNSAWIRPAYLTGPRNLHESINNVILEESFNYRIASQKYDEELYDLRFLYKGFKNNANLIIYQGVTDFLIDHHAKAAIFESVEHVTFNMITEQEVDGLAIRSTAHGDADFLELFHKVAREHAELFSVQQKANIFDSVETINTDIATYRFDFIEGRPNMTRSKRSRKNGKRH